MAVPGQGLAKIPPVKADMFFPSGASSAMRGREDTHGKSDKRIPASPLVLRPRDIAHTADSRVSVPLVLLDTEQGKENDRL